MKCIRKKHEKLPKNANDGRSHTKIHLTTQILKAFEQPDIVIGVITYKRKNEGKNLKYSSSVGVKKKPPILGEI